MRLPPFAWAHTLGKLGLKVRSPHRRRNVLRTAEPLEQRLVLSAYYFSGPSTVKEGAPYALTLTTDDASINSWQINWGDGQVQTLEGNHPTASHRYQRPAAAANIVATASDGVHNHVATAFAGDSSFNGSGFLLSPAEAPTTSDSDLQLLAQANGKLVTIHETIDPLSNHIEVILTRYNTNGSIDTSFGTAGTVVTDTQSFYGGSFLTASAADGGIAIAVAKGDGGLLVLRYNASGSLVSNFGTAGRATVNVANSVDSLAMDLSGRVFLAGYGSDNSGNTAFWLECLNTNGTLNSSFGYGYQYDQYGNPIYNEYDDSYSWGTTGVSFETYGWTAQTKLTFDNYGNLVVAGLGSYYNVLYVATFDLSGGLESGVQQFYVSSSSSASIQDIANVAGQVVIAGVDGSIHAWSVAYNSYYSSEYSATFSGGSIGKVAIQSDGSLLVAGPAAGSGGTAGNWNFQRFRSDGYPDYTFGLSSVVTLGLGPGLHLSALVGSAGGKTALAGRYVDSFAVPGQFVIGRLALENILPVEVDHPPPAPMISGAASALVGQPYSLNLSSVEAGDETVDSWTIDWGDGQTQTVLGNPSSVTHVYEAPGIIWTIAAAATDEFGTYAAPPFSLNTAFSTDGLISDPTGFTSRTTTLVQTDGKVIDVGMKYNSVTQGWYAALVRYDSQGQLDSSFGVQGMATFALPSGCTVTSAAIDVNGQILLTARSSTSSSFDLYRISATGALDSNFGTAGKATLNFSSSGILNVTVIACLGDGSITLSGNGTQFNGNAFVELVRSTSTGAIDNSFGAAGHLTLEIGQAGAIQQLLIQPDGKILIGLNHSITRQRQNTTVSGNSFEVLRFTSAGNLDSGFGVNGEFDSPFRTDNNTQSDQVNCLALQPDGKILVLRTLSQFIGPGWWATHAHVALARLTSDGHLDSAFHQTGDLITDSSGGTRAAYSVSALDGGLIAVAGAASDGSANGSLAALAFFNPDGSVSNTFGNGGQLLFSYPSWYDQYVLTDSSRALNITLAPNGRIFVAGIGAQSAPGLASVGAVDVERDATVPPAAPSDLQIAALSEHELQLSWRAGDNNATYYSIERSTGDDDWATIHSLSASFLSYLDGDLDEGTTYFYRVVARNVLTDGSIGSSASASITGTTLPAAPSGLQIVGIAADHVDFAWQNSSTTASAMYIEQMVGGNWTQIGTASGNDTSATIYGTFTPLTSYQFQIVAFGLGGYSGPSSTVVSDIDPAPPTNFVALALSDSIVHLSWDAVAGATHYGVDRSLDGIAWQTISSTLPATAVAFDSTGLNETTQYYYRVYATNNAPGFQPSEVVSVTTLPKSPGDFHIDALTTTAVQFSWTNQSAVASALRVEQWITGAEGSQWKQIGSVAADVTSVLLYGDFSATGDNSFRMEAYAQGLYSAPAQVIFAGVAPTNLVATATSDSTVILTLGLMKCETLFFESLSNQCSPDELGIRIYVPDLFSHDVGLTDLIWIIIETGSGEENAAAIKHLEVAPISSAGEHAISVSQLSDFLRWRRSKRKE